MISNFKNIIAILSFGVIIIISIYIGINKYNLKEEISVNSNISNEEENEVLLSNLEKDNQNNNNEMNNNFNNDAQNNNDEEIRRLEEILNNPFFILINKNNTLSEDYIPDNLKKCEVNFLEYAEDNLLNANVADALKEMFDDALEDKISLIGISGYRSYSVQKTLYESRVQKNGKEKTSVYTAEPGLSEHQSGLAIDILCNDYKSLDEGFENTEAFRWLKDNCYNYGFILRYLKGKEDITGYNYEPWHFRYIGNTEIAKEIMTREITFEEYIDELKYKIEYFKNNQ